MTAPEVLSILPVAAVPALFDMLALAALGLPVLALVNQLLAAGRGKVFHDKYAQQSVALGFILILVTLAATAAGMFVAMGRAPWMGQWLTGEGSPFVPALLAMAATAACVLPYHLLWKKLNRSNGMRTMLGLAASLASLACLVGSALALTALGSAWMNEIHAVPGAQATGFGPALDGTLPALPLALASVNLALCHAAGLSLPWLALRRNADDFGRDYYAFAMRNGAAWALLFTLAQAGCLAWAVFAAAPAGREAFLGSGLGAAWYASLGLAGAAALLFAILAANDRPMRLKVLAFLAAALLLGMQAMLTTICMAGLGI